MWQGVKGTQKQVRALISGLGFAVKTRLLSSNECSPG